MVVLMNIFVLLSLGNKTDYGHKLTRVHIRLVAVLIAIAISRISLYIVNLHASVSIYTGNIKVVRCKCTLIQINIIFSAISAVQNL